MKAFRVLIFVLFFIAFLNLQWTEDNPSEYGSCQNLNQILYKLEQSHVTALSHPNDFMNDAAFRKRVKKNFLTLIDPYQINLTEDQVNRFLGADTARSFCGSLYELVDQAEQAYIQTFNVLENLDSKSITRLSKNSVLPEKFPDNQEDKNLKIPNFISHLSEDGLNYEQNWDYAVKTTIRGLRRELIKQSKSLLFDSEGMVVKSLVNALDPHSDYFMNKNFLNKSRWLKSSFVGLGILVKEVFHGYKILDLVKNGPAERQKVLKKGDVIVRADGQPLTELDQSDLSGVLGGEPNSYAQLIVERETKKIRLYARRGRVKNNQSLMTKMIKYVNGYKVASISFSQFYVQQNGVASVSDEFFAALKEFNKNKVDGLVIDLRGNLGGVLQEVVKIVGFFIPSGPVVMEYTTAQQGIKFYNDDDNISYFNKPVVVLTNRSSASASEILAGSLKSLNRGIVVGSEQTFGKGTVQTVDMASQFLGNSSVSGALKLTTGYYFLPNGESTQFSGVKSHFVIDPYKQSQKKESQDQGFVEENYGYALSPPDKLNVQWSDNIKWISDTDFEDMLKYLSSNQKMRKILKRQPEKVLDKAFLILADAINFHNQYQMRIANGVNH
ncbi:MAG: PDZ domain-containing protein [Bdellovibrionales bacterium]|nr:PDZ domain-containing protein [Bdellovibrionales bacterium]